MCMPEAHLSGPDLPPLDEGRSLSEGWDLMGLGSRVMGCLMFDYTNILQENVEPGREYCHDLVPYGFTNWPGQWQVGFSCSGL